MMRLETFWKITFVLFLFSIVKGKGHCRCSNKSKVEVMLKSARDNGNLQLSDDFVVDVIADDVIVAKDEANQLRNEFKILKGKFKQMESFDILPRKWTQKVFRKPEMVLIIAMFLLPCDNEIFLMCDSSIRKARALYLRISNLNELIGNFFHAWGSSYCWSWSLSFHKYVDDLCIVRRRNIRGPKIQISNFPGYGSLTLQPYRGVNRLNAFRGCVTFEALMLFQMEGTALGAWRPVMFRLNNVSIKNDMVTLEYETKVVCLNVSLLYHSVALNSKVEMPIVWNLDGRFENKPQIDKRRIFFSYIRPPQSYYGYINKFPRQQYADIHQLPISKKLLLQMTISI